MVANCPAREDWRNLSAMAHVPKLEAHKLATAAMEKAPLAEVQATDKELVCRAQAED